MYMGYVDLTEAKQTAIDINNRSLSGELHPIFVRYEMGVLFEKIKDAMFRGQKFKQVKVKTPGNNKPLTAIWLEEREPNKQDQVEVLTVEHVGRLAYIKN